MRNEQERLAREWAERKREQAKRHWEDSGYSIREDTQAAIDYILATTTPEPTMADVEWDDEKHRGLGAVDEAGQEWVMLQDDGGYINCIGLDLNPVGAERGELTPNGKRYELREVTGEPEHPEVLSTVEDYEDAPEGTIVAFDNGSPYVKLGSVWVDRGGHLSPEFGMAGTSRQVLRKGWEK